jgi:hypothetical protein
MSRPWVVEPAVTVEAAAVATIDAWREKRGAVPTRPRHQA